MVSDEKSEKFTVRIILLQGMHHFSLDDFEIFLSLVFSGLIMIYLGVACFVFIWFKVHWASWICKFPTCTKFVKFSDNFFSLIFLFLSFWWREYLIFCYCPTNPWGLLPFINLFFSMMFRLDHFYWRVIMFWLYCHLQSAVELIQWSFFPKFFFLIFFSKISITVLHLLFLCWEFYFFIHFKGVLLY